MIFKLSNEHIQYIGNSSVGARMAYNFLNQSLCNGSVDSTIYEKTKRRHPLFAAVDQIEVCDVVQLN